MLPNRALKCLLSNCHKCFPTSSLSFAIRVLATPTSLSPPWVHCFKFCLCPSSFSDYCDQTFWQENLRTQRFRSAFHSMRLEFILREDTVAGGEGKAAGTEGWLVTSYPHPGSREWTGNEARVQNTEAHPLWPTSSSKAVPPKDSKTSSDSATSWRSRVQTLEPTYGSHRTFLIQTTTSQQHACEVIYC